ncbi:MAG TPA: hypothetical protein VGM21_09840 [Actinomycetota bacterium]
MNTTRWSTGRSQIMHLTRWWTMVDEAMIVIRPVCSSIIVLFLGGGPDVAGCCSTQATAKSASLSGPASEPDCQSLN